MASVYKRAGKKNYTVSYKDARGRWRTVTGCSDKGASLAMGQKLETEALLRRRGIIDEASDRLVEYGQTPLTEHVEAYCQYLQGKGDKARHVAETRRDVKTIFKDCGFAGIRDAEALKVMAHVAVLQKRGMGLCRINHLLTAIKGFGRWLYRNGRLAQDPFLQVSKLNASRDRRHVRRALTDEELARLIQTTAEGSSVQRMPGPTRALLYRLAAETGLRKSELRSLTVESFDLADLERASVTITAGYAKNGKTHTLPMRPGLAKAVADFLKERKPGRLFAHLDRASEIIRADLERARAAWLEEVEDPAERQKRERSAMLAYKDTGGRVADFHSLRHTFITRLARSGASPAEAKALARHSTITLTVDHYTHLRIEDERKALNALPDLDIPPKGRGAVEELAATGTDGKAGIEDSTTAGAQNMQKTTVSDGLSQSRIGTPKDAEGGCAGMAWNTRSGRVKRIAPLGKRGGRGGSRTHTPVAGERILSP